MRTAFADRRFKEWCILAFALSAFTLSLYGCGEKASNTNAGGNNWNNGGGNTQGGPETCAPDSPKREETGTYMKQCGGPPEGVECETVNWDGGGGACTTSSIAGKCTLNVKNCQTLTMTSGAGGAVVNIQDNLLTSFTYTSLSGGAKAHLNKDAKITHGSLSGAASVANDGPSLLEISNETKPSFAQHGKEIEERTQNSLPNSVISKNVRKREVKRLSEDKQADKTNPSNSEDPLDDATALYTDEKTSPTHDAHEHREVAVSLKSLQKLKEQGTHTKGTDASADRDGARTSVAGAVRHKRGHHQKHHAHTFLQH